MLFCALFRPFKRILRMFWYSRMVETKKSALKTLILSQDIFFTFKDILFRKYLVVFRFIRNFAIQLKMKCKTLKS